MRKGKLFIVEYIVEYIVEHTVVIVVKFSYRNTKHNSDG